jgi:hypothetical protein
MTGALFYLAINPYVSAILVQNTLGPASAAAQIHGPGFPDWELPALQKLSDMMWAMYEFYVKQEDWHKIDFFMSLAISNGASKALIRRALESEGQVLGMAPYKFEPGSEGFLAILGKVTCCGVGVSCEWVLTMCRLSKRRACSTFPYAAQEPDWIEDCSWNLCLSMCVEIWRCVSHVQDASSGCCGTAS